MALRDLALTVLELDDAQFHWVLLEAVETDADDSLVYRPVDSSTSSFEDYEQALYNGTVALRHVQGLLVPNPPEILPAAPPFPPAAVRARAPSPHGTPIPAYPSDVASLI